MTSRPLNAETPPHLLDDEVTPTARHFIRNIGIVPADLDPGAWELRIDGLVERPMTLRIDDLRSRFEVVTHRLVIVKSLITRPATGGRNQGRELEVAGHAWAGDSEVARVDVAIDFGATWLSTQLSPPHNPHAWQRFGTRIVFPQSGYFEVWARAADISGARQPFRAAWNPKGYLNNAMHHVSVQVTEWGQGTVRLSRVCPASGSPLSRWHVGSPGLQRRLTAAALPRRTNKRFLAGCRTMRDGWKCSGSAAPATR